MHECRQFHEKAKYTRIVARIPADLEQACRHLAHNEGWGIGDLYRNLILLGACASFLTLRSRNSLETLQGSGLPKTLRRYLGRRMYAPRTVRRSALVTVSLPKRLAWLLGEYSNLSGRLRSHTYVRLLRAGLIVYLTSEREFADRCEAANAGRNTRQKSRRR